MIRFGLSLGTLAGAFLSIYMNSTIGLMEKVRNGTVVIIVVLAFLIIAEIIEYYVRLKNTE